MTLQRALPAAEEGLPLAESIGDRFTARLCRFSEGWARAWQGDHARAQALYDALIDEAAAEHDVVTRMYSLATKGFMLAFVGEAGAAAEVADAALDCNAKLTGAFEGVCHSVAAAACLVAGDAEAARLRYEAARRISTPPGHEGYEMSRPSRSRRWPAGTWKRRVGGPTSMSRVPRAVISLPR